jgi:hypothetical protein
VRRSKDRARFTLNGWLNQLETHGPSAHLMSSERLGFDVQAEISKLSVSQLRLMSSLAAATSSLGWEQARQQRRGFLQDCHGDKRVFERRQSFRVIQGGAA